MHALAYALLFISLSVAVYFAWNAMWKAVDEDRARNAIRMDAPPESRLETIQCTICGRDITPGKGIAAYGGEPTRPEWTTRLPDGRSIGCLRMDCCTNSGYFIGNWTGKEVIFRFPNGATAAQHVTSTKEGVLIHDTEQEKESTP